MRSQLLQFVVHSKAKEVILKDNLLGFLSSFPFSSVITKKEVMLNDLASSDSMQSENT